GDPPERELEDAVEVPARERPTLGRSLHLDELALPGRDDIHVGVGDRVFGVREVEHEVALHIAGGDRGDVPHDRRRLHLAYGVREGDESAGDRGGARAAVGLEDLAVDDHAARPERFQVDRGAQRPPDQTLDLERTAAGTSGDALTLAPFRRAPREHRVLGGDPSRALALEELRHALLEGGETEHLRVAERDARGAFGELRDTDLDRDRPQGVGLASVRPHVAHAVSSHTRRISSGAYDSMARPSFAARASTRATCAAKRSFAARSALSASNPASVAAATMSKSSSPRNSSSSMSSGRSRRGGTSFTRAARSCIRSAAKRAGSPRGTPGSRDFGSSPCSSRLIASHCARRSPPAIARPANTCGCRRMSFSFRRRATSRASKVPSSRAISPWSTICSSRSPSSSRRRAGSPESRAARASYASSSRCGLSDACVCSRSHGHPFGARSRSAIRATVSREARSAKGSSGATTTKLAPADSRSASARVHDRSLAPPTTVTG